MCETRQTREKGGERNGEKGEERKGEIGTVDVNEVCPRRRKILLRAFDRSHTSDRLLSPRQEASLTAWRRERETSVTVELERKRTPKTNLARWLKAMPPEMRNASVLKRFRLLCPLRA